MRQRSWRPIRQCWIICRGNHRCQTHEEIWQF